MLVMIKRILIDVLLHSGYVDEPIRKRLTNSDAEDIAQRNIHGSMSNILHTQSKLLNSN